MLKKLRQWVEVRIGLDELIKAQFTEYRVPKNINIFYTLGFVTMAGFIIQIITGFLLLIYYVPDPDHAFTSVQDIMVRIPYGWLIRLMHVVGSSLIVVAVGLHMISVFFMHSYKKPRELNWLAGALLMAVTLAFCLSGYLLPWSQLSYWATTIVTSIPSAVPVVGDYVVMLTRGGQNVTGATLGRFFVLHVALLPAALLLLVGLHLFLVRRIGISAPPFGATAEEKEPWQEFKHEEHPAGPPFFPNFMLKETFVVMLFFSVMFFIITFLPTLFLPADTTIPADPMTTPGHIKPEWYFLAPYQTLKLIPSKLIGICLQTVFIVLFLLWPFLDRHPEENILKRRVLLGTFVFGFIAWFVLTVWGKYS